MSKQQKTVEVQAEPRGAYGVALVNTQGRVLASVAFFRGSRRERVISRKALLEAFEDAEMQASMRALPQNKTAVRTLVSAAKIRAGLEGRFGHLRTIRR